MRVMFFLILIFLLNNLYAKDDIFDDSLENILNMQTELKTDVGSRGDSQNFLDSAVPVDVITYKQIDKSGLTSLTDILRYFIPGFNAPETSVADGSDHIRAFTLRGMGPDQILVLVNGKRVHSSALLHVNGTIGRGSSSVDLDTIAPTSIQRVEILRDGAAAQYGSDAISGVINIILKGMGHKNRVSVHAGKRIKGDGEQLDADAFLSMPLKYDGFFNLTLQSKNQKQTNRSGAGITHVGIPDSKNFLALLNVDLPQKGGTELYATSTLNYRDSKASAFYRDANATEAGFLPLINAKILDYALTFGIKGELANKVFWDLSNVYGMNEINYYVSNSKNYSLGSASANSFYNGGLKFIQNTTNLDFKRDFDNFHLALGSEFRYENYQLQAGDKNSYVDGGSQGFSGYTPYNATDDTRTNYAFYLDTTYNFTKALFSETAIRFENFSDFGSATSVKLALSYKLNAKVLLRTSTSTGFRAPSLSQSSYSHTSTFGGRVEGTFKPSAEISKQFGAKPLKAESSQHFTVGSVYQADKSTSFVVDYFYTKVDNRIMLSNEFTLTPAQQAQYSINRARFFTNAVNTTTQGIDIKFNKKYKFLDASRVDFGIWYSHNQNRVTGFNDSSTTRANSYEQIDRVENAQPKDNVKILTSYKLKHFTTTLNLNRYGSYAQVIDNVSYKFKSAWSVDLDFDYKLYEDIELSIGANNILNAMPNRWDGLRTSNSHYGYNDIKPYSRYSPFGYSGAYYYAKATLRF